MSDAAPPRPGPAARRLEPFVGVWRTRGQVLAEDGPSTEIVGTDTYEWLPGGHFLLHRVDVRMGGERAEVLEVIGWDMERGEYFMHAYDSQGNHGTLWASVQDGAWTFEGDAERFTGSFGDGGATLAGRWERLDGGEWIPWMDIHLTRE